MTQFLLTLLAIAVVGLSSCSRGSPATPAPTAAATPGPVAAPTPTPTAAPGAAATSSPTPQPGEEVTAIIIEDRAFNPDSVMVMTIAGMTFTVTWTNRDSVTHTVTGPGFDSGPLAPGASFTRSFITDAGGVDYWCTIHPNMNGLVDIMLH